MCNSSPFRFICIFRCGFTCHDDLAGVFRAELKFDSFGNGFLAI